MGVLAAGVGFAKDENAAGAKCSEATLNGRYLLAFDGFIVKGDDQIPFAVANFEVFHGNGNANGVSSFSVNGKITRKEPISATYTVWTYPASVDTSPSRSVFSYQFNLLELGGAQIA